MLSFIRTSATGQAHFGTKYLDEETAKIVIPFKSSVSFPSKGYASKFRARLLFGFIGNCEDAAAVTGKGVKIKRIFRAIMVTIILNQDLSETTEHSLTTGNNCMLRFDKAVRYIAIESISTSAELKEDTAIQLFS